MIPLSYGQHRLWMLDQLEGPNPTYNVPLALRLAGPLDREALRGALDDVVHRHESLRTLIAVNGETPYQRILSAADAHVPLSTVTLGGAPADGGGPGPELRAFADQPFRLDSDLPVRACLFELAGEEHVLVVVVHHIVSDGWSLGPLARDLAEAYAARLNGTEPGWQPLPVQYADYTLWQRELLGDDSDPASLVNEQLSYWRGVLDGLPDQLTLPFDRFRPSTPTYHGGTVPLALDADTHTRLTRLAREHGATTFMAVQAALAGLLTRLGAGTDIPIGTPIAGRTEQALDDLVGFFVNTLVLRTATTGNPTFTELLTRVRDTNLAAYAHQDLPFERLVEDLNPARTPGRHPLFQTMLVLQNNTTPQLHLPGLHVTDEPLTTDTAKFDLTVDLTERFTPTGQPDGIHGVLEYATDLFDAHTAHHLATALAHTLHHTAHHPHTPLHNWNILAPEDGDRVLAQGRGHATEIPTASVHGRFEDQARRTPDAVALVSGGTELNYAELDARADRLAARLAAYGVTAESAVAVLMERSPELVVALLAVLKAGGCYVPLHPEFPRARREHILAEARCAVLLTDDPERWDLAAAETAEGVLVVPLGATADRPAAGPAGNRRDVSPDRLAYIMYTSGSTGQPKGVAVRHRDVLALTVDRHWHTGHDRVLMHSPHSFDASTYELWVPLTSGGSVVVAPPGPVDAHLVRRLVEAHGVTALWLTAGLFRVMAEDSPEAFRGLSELWTGGDVVSPEAARRVLAACPSLHLFNGYGPTETTTFAAAHSIDSVTAGRTAIPIGRPLDNTRLYVLDGDLAPVPPGVEGDLYIGGAGVARGYAGDPRLTAQRFVPDPFGPPGARMYRSGDRARWVADGVLEYRGRDDDQVKLRGLRIDLGEVEAALARQPDVSQATVTVRQDASGAQRLVGYYVPAGGAGREAVSAALTARLREELPTFMVPAVLVGLERLPLTENGKVDRRALPEPPAVRAPRAVARPRTPREALLCALAAELLRVGEVHPDDNFLDLGGDSILAIQLASRARQAGLLLSARDVFRHGSLAETAAAALDAEEEREPRSAAWGAVPATPIIEWLRETGGPFDGFHQSVLLHTPAWLRPQNALRALQSVLDRHDMLRARLDTDAAGVWTLLVSEPGTVRAEDCWEAVDIALPRADDTSGSDRLADAARSAVTRLAPRRGVMVRGVMENGGPGAPGRLALVVHHLVVDGVSWRILVEDFVAAARAHAIGTEPELSTPGTSYRTWSRRLVQAAGAEAVGELAHWRDTLDRPDPPLGDRPLDPGQDVQGSARTLTVTLPTGDTGGLLTAVAKSFHAGPDEILLTGLALGVERWRRRGGATVTGLLVNLEGHGREAIAEGLDVSRTVGWFTSLYPVHLDPGVSRWEDLDVGDPELGRALKRVKEQLRAVPGKGIGFGLLRRLNPATADELSTLPVPQLCFNYLGRATGTAAGADGWAVDPSFRIDTTGHDTARPLAHALTVDVLVQDGADGPELTATWTWPEALLSTERVQDLADDWFAALRAVAEHAARPGSGGRSPSDVPLVVLGQDTLERLEERIPGLADVVPLSPLQEGMLFHAEYDRTGPDPYNVQISLPLEGPLDPVALRAAAALLLARHSALRSAFLEVPDGGAVQVVLDAEACPPPWTEHDLSRLPRESAEAELSRLQDEDRARRFDLSSAPLLRFALVRLAADRWHLMLTNHHILLDGWSAPLVVQELFRLYAGQDELLPARPYKDYLRWLAAQDDEAARRAWRESLAGLEGPTLIAPGGSRAGWSAVGRLTGELTEEATARLQECARGLGVTLNTVVQAAWAVVLSRLTGRTDVVFGATVSGRPAELPGVEGMVGLFINTVPVRVRLDPAQSLADLLVRLQREQAALLDHHHLGLTDIHRITAQPSLFDTMIAFENYPFDPDALPADGIGVSIGEPDVRDGVHYPLALLATPGDRLHLRMDHDVELLPVATAEALRDLLLGVLERVAQDPAARTDTLPDLAGVIPERALAVSTTGPAFPAGPQPPRTARSAALERKLSELFEDVLGVPEIGPYDDFFELGGHSLTVARLVRRIRAELGRSVDLRILYEAPTVAELAGRLVTGNDSCDLDVLLPLRTEGGRAPLFCLPPGIGISWSYMGLTQHIGADRPLYALQSRGIGQPGAQPADMSAVVADCVAQLRTVRPSGPYHLLGWSFGGVLAHGVAEELQRQGEQVGVLAMLDSYPAGAVPPLSEQAAEEGVLRELAARLGHDLDALGMAAPRRGPVLDLLGKADFPDRRTLEAVVDTGINNHRLLREFTPGVFRGDLLFFTAARDLAEGRSARRSWQGHITGRVVEHLVDSGHMDMTTPQALTVIGKHLDSALAAAEAGDPPADVHRQRNG
ncbi:amino acid adenylation domain-containing protein [Streptomyces sp. NPDC127106]|uniref:amino acid adenylation domain-containing protein n=1 Tax=Streptomyces sp. NPDC127106 TaxID=3345360 RepID=UPI00362B5842